MIKTNFLGEETPKESINYTCISCITIDSVMTMEKMNYPEVYLEECKYRMKKTKMTKIICTELESDSDSEAKLESGSDSKRSHFTRSNRWLIYP